MSQVIEDEVAFRGGTLQISDTDTNRSSGQEDESYRSVAKRPLAPESSRPFSGELSKNVSPSILSGTDAMSQGTSSSSMEDERRGDNVVNENIEQRNASLLPSYDVTFSSDNIRDYFTYRSEIVQQAISDCIAAYIFPDSDGHVIGSWLLTEISIWDNEKERLLILTSKEVIVVKYDFIALKTLDHRKILLSNVDTIVIGDLTYPPASLVPRLNGLATGVTSIVKECIVDRLIKNKPPNEREESKLFDGKYFQPRARKTRGIRLMWNKGQAVPTTKLWNPFSQDIPFTTFISHPVFWHKDIENQAHRTIYDMETFSEALMKATENLPGTDCCIHHSPIVIQSYLGVTSLVHNKNGLGFFKVRGKFSF